MPETQQTIKVSGDHYYYDFIMISFCNKRITEKCVESNIKYSNANIQESGLKSILDRQYNSMIFLTVYLFTP